MKILGFFVLLLSVDVSAKALCQSNTEMPLDQVGKNGVVNLMSAVSDAANASLVKQEDVDLACEAICTNDVTFYKDAVEVMMEPYPGTAIEKSKKFHSELFFNTKCSVKTIFNGNSSCSHKGDNFLRTAISDGVDPVVKELVNNAGVNLLSKDPDDGLTTVDWVKKKCKDNQSNANQSVAKYYCDQAKFIECRSMGKVNC